MPPENYGPPMPPDVAAKQGVDGRNTKEKIDAYWTPFHAKAYQEYQAASLRGQDTDQLLGVNVPGRGYLGLSQVQTAWDLEKSQLNAKPKPGGGGGGGGRGGGGGGGGAAGAGGTKNVAPKKPEPPPAPTSKLVSFGKLFSSFCLPAMTASAAEQNIDEVQVNFYQLNESCGPISLHSIAEFPIEIDHAEAKFAAEAERRGGESMTVFEFISWCSESLFSDKRAPGYGMREIYEPAAVDAEAEKAKDDANAAAKDSKIQEFFTKYGTFKQPTLAMKIDVFYEGDNNKIDLLYKLQYRVGAQYNAPPPKFAGPENKKLKRIMKISLFDRTFNVYSKTAKVLQDKDGKFRAFETDVTSEEIKLVTDRVYADLPPATEPQTYEINGKSITVGRAFSSGKNVLKNYIGESIPKIDVGINSSMIINASFSSQISGLAGTIAMKNAFSKSTLAPNAMMSNLNNLPIKVMPGELTLNTVGCPLADIMQSFLVDFDTGTTLDAIYKVTGVQHNFSLGKFETAWTMKHFDSYSTFFGAATVANLLKEVGKDTKEKNERDEASGERVPDPIPLKSANMSETAETKK